MRSRTEHVRHGEPHTRRMLAGAASVSSSIEAPAMPLPPIEWTGDAGRGPPPPNRARGGDTMTEQDRPEAPGEIERRSIMRAAGATLAAGALAETPATAQPAPGRANRDSGPLGARLQGVQHFG